MDRGGATAAAGTIRHDLLRALLRHPYLKAGIPKTTGRDMFGRALVTRMARWAQQRRVHWKDLVATATAFTAASIADAYARYLAPDGAVHEVIVGGGGVFNAALMRGLRERFAGAPVDSMAAHGIVPKAIEAMAFALLAYTTFHREANNVPAATGAARRVVLGKIIPS